MMDQPPKPLSGSAVSSNTTNTEIPAISRLLLPDSKSSNTSSDASDRMDVSPDASTLVASSAASSANFPPSPTPSVRSTYSSSTSSPPSPTPPVMSTYSNSNEATPRSSNSNSPYVNTPLSSARGSISEETSSSTPPHLDLGKVAEYSPSKETFSRSLFEPTLPSPPLDKPVLVIGPNSYFRNCLEYDKGHVAKVLESIIMAKQYEARRESITGAYDVLGDDGYFHPANQPTIIKIIPEGKLQFVIFVKNFKLCFNLGSTSHFYLCDKEFAVILAGDAYFDKVGHINTLTDGSGTYNPFYKSATERLEIYAIQRKALHQLKIFPVHGLIRPFDPMAQAIEEGERLLELKMLAAEQKQETKATIEVTASLPVKKF